MPIKLWSEDCPSIVSDTVTFDGMPQAGPRSGLKDNPLYSGKYRPPPVKVVGYWSRHITVEAVKPDALERYITQAISAQSLKVPHTYDLTFKNVRMGGLHDNSSI